MFATQLPASITVITADQAMWETPLTEQEENLIARAIDKRKREFRAGRNAAKQGLQRLGLNGDISILSGDNRRPIWPAGFLGSITHTDGFCAAAVASSALYSGIGIDVEPRTPLKNELLEYICTPTEQVWLASQGTGQHCLGKVFFCVKETLYKVFNPIHQVFLGFQEAEVTLQPDRGSFRAEIWQREKNIRCVYHGRFSMDDNFIYASTFLTR